nr:retrovirus-related Pol polyprotein LINE-1 [Tanacetum cinerariifolium]
TRIKVKQSKDKAYEELYKRLDSKDGTNDIYKIAKAQERRRRDIESVRYIKDEGGRTIVREDDIKKRWGEYFSSLFNETPADESRHDGSGEVGSSSLHRHFDCYYSRINQGEVMVALQKKGRNKVIFPSAKMPNEWRLSEVIPIYKNKGDAQACSNYRGIKLLSHTMKLWERVIEKRVRMETRVLENQFGFMPGRSATEAIHLLRSLMEKYRERHRGLHMAFLDLKKAYDSAPRELVWKTLIDKGKPSRYLKVIQDMYEGRKTRVRTIVGEHRVFPGGREHPLVHDICRRYCVDRRVGGRVKQQTLEVEGGTRRQWSTVKRVEALLVEGSRIKGRPKLRWEDRLKLDMKEILLSEDMTSDRNVWRDRIRIRG